MVVLFRVVGGIGVGVASVIAPAYIAETSPPRHPRPARFVAAVGDRVRHLPVLRHQLRCCNARGRAQRSAVARPRRLAVDVPGDGDARDPLRRAGVHHSRITAVSRCQPQDSGSAAGAEHAAGEKNLEITIDRIKETLEREDKPSWKDLRKPTGGIYGIVWVGLGLSVFQQFVGINVIFYYSNVLWQAVGFSADVASVIHRDHLGDQRAHHADRHRADRQDRPQAAAAHRFDRHGRDPDDNVGHLRQRHAGPDGNPTCPAHGLSR